MWIGWNLATEVDPISWTGLRVTQARVRMLLAMIPLLVRANFSCPSIPPPEHSWPPGTPWSGSYSPGLDGVSGHCRTGSRLPLHSVLRWRWRRLSGTLPLISASAYFSVRHNRATNMLAVYRPFPCLLIFTPCSGSVWVNSRLVNWLPWSVLKTSGWTCLMAYFKASTQKPAPGCWTIARSPRTGGTSP